MTYECELAFSAIDAAIRVTCSDRLVLERIAAQLSTASGVVAALSMTVKRGAGSGRAVGAVHVESARAGSAFAVSFSGSASTRRYIADIDEIVADTYTVVLAVLQTALMPRSVIAIHAAFLDVHGAGVLVAGPSGAGKTSTSVAALEAGFAVFASEITFIGDGWVLLGESSLTIEAGAMAEFGLGVPENAERRGTSWIVPLPVLFEPRMIDVVVFPRVGLFPCVRRRVPRRSAEVQAFECVTSQASVWRMVGNRTEHVSVPWDASSSVHTINQAFRICDRPTWLIGGTPQTVVSSIAEIVGCNHS